MGFWPPEGVGVWTSLWFLDFMNSGFWLLCLSLVLGCCGCGLLLGFSLVCCCGVLFSFRIWFYCLDWRVLWVLW